MPITRPATSSEVIVKWRESIAASDVVAVAEGDSCISMQSGQVLGVFPPGSHALPAQIPAGVELWFCLTRPVSGRRFGGNLPTGGSAFGEYTYQVTAGHLLVTKLAGNDNVEGMLKSLDANVLPAIGAGFGHRPPTPEGLEAAKAKAAAALTSEWASLGVAFVSFDKLMTR